MLLRLTESDLRGLISSAVSKILRESMDNNGLLGNIVEKLSGMDIEAKPGQNDIEVPLDNEADDIVFITFTLEDGRYMIDTKQPDYPYEIEGDYNIVVDKIVMFDDYNNEHYIEDNGMVADALKSLVTVGEDHLEYWDDEDNYGDYSHNDLGY